MNRLTAVVWKQGAFARLLAACLGAAVFGLFLLAALEPFRAIGSAEEIPLSGASYTCSDEHVDCLAAAEALHHYAAAFRSEAQRHCALPGAQVFLSMLTKAPLFAAGSAPSLRSGSGTPFKLRI
ncbi:MAG: hypothetical protein LBR16_00990 [Treponema sp.]|jgi:hypothetical protein|nr:hypothetical protein [Treponema sp.]